MDRQSDTGPDDPHDAAALAAHAATLVAAVDAHLAAWVERRVVELHRAWAGSVPDAVAAAAVAAGERARAEVVPRVRALLERDVDDQPTGPLALLRGAAPHATSVLRAAGVPPVVRDEVATRLHPDDLYDLGPATFADLDPAVHEPGLVWGAAKAHVVLARRRREGRR